MKSVIERYKKRLEESIAEFAEQDITACNAKAMCKMLECYDKIVHMLNYEDFA